jgi:hypothetical protein
MTYAARLEDLQEVLGNPTVVPQLPVGSHIDESGREVHLGTTGNDRARRMSSVTMRHDRVSRSYRLGVAVTIRTVPGTCRCPRPSSGCASPNLARCPGDRRQLRRGHRGERRAAGGLCSTWGSPLTCGPGRPHSAASRARLLVDFSRTGAWPGSVQAPGSSLSSRHSARVRSGDVIGISYPVATTPASAPGARSLGLAVECPDEDVKHSKFREAPGTTYPRVIVGSEAGAQPAEVSGAADELQPRGLPRAGIRVAHWLPRSAARSS